MNLQGLHSATKERFASLHCRRQICRLLTPSFVLTVGCKYIENVCGIKNRNGLSLQEKTFS